ncbi:hypothetical protein EBU94_07250, partial [bacterium]|nr:hypothetical protein [bacterium]
MWWMIKGYGQKWHSNVYLNKTEILKAFKEIYIDKVPLDALYCGEIQKCKFWIIETDDTFYMFG